MLPNIIRRFFPGKPYTVETAVANIRKEKAKIEAFAQRKHQHIEQTKGAIDRLHDRVSTLATEKNEAMTVAGRINI